MQYVTAAYDTGPIDYQAESCSFMVQLAPPGPKPPPGPALGAANQKARPAAYPAGRGFRAPLKLLYNAQSIVLRTSCSEHRAQSIWLTIVQEIAQ